MRPDTNPNPPSRGVPAPVPNDPDQGPAKRRACLHALALVALALTVYLPGLFTIPPVDRGPPSAQQCRECRVPA